MASFTDKTPQFNPYVSQQPIQSMVQVGMMKQQQYDTNLESIYQSMGQIAGMDIMHEKDQEYLKNKMNEVSGDLRGYAAADFSNRNLTRRVNGIVTNIAEDETIRTAVQSTAKIRSEMSKMNKAKEDGKSSVVNEWALGTQINDYLNSGVAGQSFNGAYIPYRDVDAKLRKLAKDLEAENVSIDHPYVRDGEGNVLYFDNKNNVSTTPKEGFSPKYNTIMITEKVKGKSAKKIYDAFLAGLDSDDLRQLQLNAEFHYRNKDIEDFEVDIKDAISEEKKFKTNVISELKLELHTNNDLTGEERNNIEKIITKLKSDIEPDNLNKKLQENLSVLKDPSNLSSIKGQLYRENYLRDLSTSLAYENKQIEIKSNPGWNAEFKTKEFLWKQNKYIEEKLYRAKRDKIEDFRWEVEQLNKTRDKKNKDLLVNSSPLEIGEYNSSIFDLQSQKKDLLEKINVTKAKFLKTMPGVTEEDLDKLFEQYMVNPSKIANSQKNRAQIIEYINTVRPDYLDHIIVANLIDSATTLPEVKNLEKEKNNLLATTVGTQNTSLAINLTSDEVLKFGRNIKDILAKYRTGRRPYSTAYGFETNPSRDALEEIKNKYTGTKYEELAKAFIMSRASQKRRIIKHDTRNNNIYPIPTDKRSSEYVLNDNYGDILSQFYSSYEEASKLAANTQNQIDEIQAQFIREKSPFALEQVATVSKEKNKVVYENIQDFLTQIKRNKAIIGGMDVYSKKDINTFETLAEAKDTEFTLNKDYYGNASLTLIGTEGQQVTIPVPSQYVNTHFPEITKVSPLNTAFRAAKASANNTSNVSPSNLNEPSPINSILTGKMSPNLAGTPYQDTVRYDIEEHPINKNRYLLKIYYNTYDGRWLTGETKEYVDARTVQAQIESVTTDTILEIIKNNL